MTVQSFGGRATEEFFVAGRIGRGVGWAAAASIACRKLDMIDHAHKLMDLRSPPGNRLEALKGKRHGSYSIRINDQWRVVFEWTPRGPTRVRITDYH